MVAITRAHIHCGRNSAFQYDIVIAVMQFTLSSESTVLMQDCLSSALRCEASVVDESSARLEKGKVKQ